MKDYGHRISEYRKLRSFMVIVITINFVISLFFQITKEISGVPVPIVLIGDPAYTLLPWLLKRFSEDGNLTLEQAYFNLCLSKARIMKNGGRGSIW